MMKNQTGMWRMYGRTVGFTLVVMYAVGLIGHLWAPTLEITLSLSAGFLLLYSVLVLIPSVVTGRLGFLLWALWTYVFVMLVEAAGVATGDIFGDYYTYGPPMGWTVWGVPYIIGFNWVMTINGTVCLASRLVPEMPHPRRYVVVVLLSAAFAMGFDVLLEPVAMRLNYWRWAKGVIPLQNYAAWFITAAVVAIGHPRLSDPDRDLGTHGRLAVLYVATQSLFFLLLQLCWWFCGA